MEMQVYLSKDRLELRLQSDEEWKVLQGLTIALSSATFDSEGGQTPESIEPLLPAGWSRHGSPEHEHDPSQAE